jgi:DNA (cytosine-5)-methyltransferase 1
MGYHRAGFDVVGVDIKPQPRYPFSFVQMDALDAMRRLNRADWYIECAADDRVWFGRDFAAIHASPPCQKFSTLSAMHKGRSYPDILPQTRELIRDSGLPWVIENVVLAKLDTATILCGSMFGLGANCADGRYHQLRRHRAFESSVFIMVQPCSHVGRPVGVYGNGGGNASRGHRAGVNGFTGKASERRDAMGIDWMTRGELSQAIPPAYTEFIGKQLLNLIGK